MKNSKFRREAFETGLSEGLDILAGAAALAALVMLTLSSAQNYEPHLVVGAFALAAGWVIFRTRSALKTNS